MELNDRIKNLAETWGADFFGVADLSHARDAILAQGGPVVSQYPRAVSLGITLFHAIVDQLPNRADRAVAIDYRHHCYDIINRRLDRVASRLSSVLQRGGYGVLPVPAARRVDDEKICASFSHKMGAHLAGLGWIGKNCLLVTPEAGPRVRWTTVLTDAPLVTTGEPMEERCGDCEACIAICPVKAFTAEPFRENEPREARFDAAKCNRYFEQMREKDAELAVCGQCLYVCPHGTK